MQDLIQRTESKVLETYLLAQSVFGRTFELPKIEYVDMGRMAGRAFYSLNLIKLSPSLLQSNKDNFIERTVPHECAHLLAKVIFPNLRRPHGPEWKSVMRALNVSEISRCHSYDTSVVSNIRSRDKFLYLCECNCRHEFGGTKHRRAQSGIVYRCLTCHKPCVYAKVRLIE